MLTEAPEFNIPTIVTKVLEPFKDSCRVYTSITLSIELQLMAETKVNIGVYVTVPQIDSSTIHGEIGIVNLGYPI